MPSTLLTIGYFTLGALPYKVTVLPALVVLMFGGSFIKSIITGTVAKTTTKKPEQEDTQYFMGWLMLELSLAKRLPIL